MPDWGWPAVIAHRCGDALAQHFHRRFGREDVKRQALRLGELGEGLALVPLQESRVHQHAPALGQQPGGARQNTSATKAVSARPKSAPPWMALVHTGL